MSNNEYSSPSVQSSACSYATLSHYNNKSQGIASLPSISKRYIVPTFSAPPGYNSISKGEPTCNGYSNIQSAYGNNKGSCGSGYISRLCQ
jgi:hypothetical protein